MLKWLLWLRYMCKVRVILLCMAAVGLSAGLLIVVASLFNGFIKAVEKTGRETFGDIYCNPGVAVPDKDAFLAKLEAMPQVQAAAVVLETYGLLHLGRGEVKGVRIIGIDPVHYGRVTDLKQALVRQGAGSSPPQFMMDASDADPGGFVGIGVLGKPDQTTDLYDFERARAAVGRSVVLTTGGAVDRDSGAASSGYKPRFLKFKIADVVFTGIYVRDERDVYLPESVVENLLGDSRREVVQIRLLDDVEPDLMLGAVRLAWEDHARSNGLSERDAARVFLRTSKQMQEFFIAELRKQMSMLMLIFGILCSAAVLLVFCVFYMIVTTRRRDIAIMKSCGASGSSVAGLFIGFGAATGLAGAFAGAALGSVVTANINAIENWIRVIFGLKLWKSSTYMFERIPSEINPGAACWIILAVVLACAAGAFIPAVAAARTRPVEVLRYE